MKFCLNILLVLGVTGCGSMKLNDCNGILDDVSQKCVYIVAEQMPVFDCSGDDFHNFIVKEFKYPPESPYASTKINAAFVIDDKGQIVGERIISKSEKDLSRVDKELLSLIKSTSGKWLPGKINNKKVAVLMILPINLEVDR